jgi:hypothetical protein
MMRAVLGSKILVIGSRSSLLVLQEPITSGSLIYPRTLGACLVTSFLKKDDHNIID